MLTELVLGGALILLLSWLIFGKPSGLPPGRWGFPIFGYIPLNGKFIDDQLMDFHKKYGDIYLWKLGNLVMVHVHDYNVCRQMYASQDFVDRPDLEFLRFNYEVAYGIASSNGSIWQANRRFILRNLRDLGMGKSSLVSAIHTQAHSVLEELKNVVGKEEPITSAVNTAVVNVVWNMVASAQFKSDDPRQNAFQMLLVKLNTIASYVAVGDMLPWTKYVLPKSIRNKLFKVEDLHSALNTFFSYFDKLIEEHQAALDPNDPKDLMDAYLLEMNEMEKAKDTNSGVRCRQDLEVLLLDLFITGSTTTTSTLEWLFLYMAAFPSVQRKMQQEIDEVLPKGTLATLEDKSRMPYLEAVINEVLRKSSLSNFGVHHAASRDTTLAGYKIPKGTVITSFNAGIHHDLRYWDKPESFLPERWLSPDGKFVMKKEGYLPFGSGKRMCIGESLARMELLIFTTAVFQNFSIAPPEGKQIDLLPNHDVLFTHEPRKQDVVFTVRN